MYLKYFGIKDYPFRLTPDTEYLYMSKAHSRAKAYMDYAIFNREGFVVITGEIGSGKTTLLKKLLSEIEYKDTIVAKIFQTQIDDVELLQSILLEFGVNTFSSNKIELLDKLNQFLIEQYSKGKKILLIIDDAQNLNIRALKEIVLLSSIETQKEKILHTILVGQPELNSLLETDELEHLLQRVSFRYHVRPLNKEETENYIKYRLKIAGIDSEKLIKKSVITSIFESSGGVPRLVNTLCDKSMTVAYADDKKVIDDKVFKDVLTELEWNKDYHASKRKTVTPISNLKESDLSQNLVNLLFLMNKNVEKLTCQVSRIASSMERTEKSEMVDSDDLDLDLSGKNTNKNTRKNIVTKKTAVRTSK